MDDLLIEYADKFGENFPLFIVRNLNDEEIINLIKTAIEKNEPYKVETDEDVDY